MAQPAEQITRVFKRLTVADVAVTGSVTADFTLAAYVSGVLTSLTWSITEIGTGHYKLIYTLPTAGQLCIFFEPATGTDYIRWADLDGELELYDLTSLYGAVVRPVVQLTATGAPTGEIALSVTKSNYHSITFSVKNTDGTAVDLSAWNAWRFGVMSANQSTTIYLQTTGITASAGGVVTIVLPEGATVFAALTTGVDSIALRWSLEGDEAADATKTRTVARGAFTIVRKET